MSNVESKGDACKESEWSERVERGHSASRAQRSQVRSDSEREKKEFLTSQSGSKSKGGLGSGEGAAEGTKAGSAVSGIWLQWNSGRRRGGVGSD